LFLVASVDLLLVQTSAAAGVGWAQLFGGPLVAAITDTRYGQLWAVRFVLAILIGVVLRLRPGASAPGADGGLPRSYDRVVLIMGAALLLTVSLSSHSAALGGLAPLTIANDWIHL